jgi:IclR family transcriptional regulator, KDG regulon repressor
VNDLDTTTEPSYRIEAVDCAIDVLQAIAREPGLSMADIARKVGGSRQRIFRMIKTLEARNLIERGRDRTYHVGYAMLLLGVAARDQSDLLQVSEPLMRDLGAIVQETVQLRIHDGDEALCIFGWEPDRAVRVQADVGKRSRFFGGSSKIFLAYMSEEARAPYLNQPMPRFTANSIVDPAVMLTRLEEIRQRGFSISKGEVNDELISISAPVLSSPGKVAAVLNVAAPASRMPDEEVAKTLQHVLDTAQRISRLIGFNPA